MQVDRSHLEQRFREMSDEELLANLRKDLTELARGVAEDELRSRGLDVAAIGEAEADSGTRPVPAHGPLKLCARYFSPIDAQVLAACLASEGLSPVVMDVDTILATGALFSSLPRGGVRVMVPESQLDAALAIRAAYDAGEMAIDENDDAWRK
jgi:hypothetical protein